MTKTIVITAGGSGGHVIPAGTLASSIINEYNVLFLTDKRGMRYKKFIPREAHVISIPCASLGGKSRLSKIKALAWTAIGIFKTMYLFLKYRPSAVIGFAGYASFPACVTGGLFFKPVILHEQNTVFGKTNRILSPFANVIATSFKNTRRLPTHKKVVFTGLPLREEILKLDNSYKSTAKSLNLIITGGSQGARFLNTISEVLCALPDKVRQKLKVIQQVVDTKEQDRIMKLYAQSKIEATITPFIIDMPQQIQNCHLFIGSSGSMVLEVQALRRPMILIPLSISAENHQETNAREMEKIGGAKVVLEKNVEFLSFQKLLLDLLENPSKLRKMHQNLKPHNGTPALVSLIKEMIKT
ncbi:MAG: UDP-N-acetylglucosamine--N-acetylmuramyl-(pentapeptide) pyrophosphoryl-undecaprenol N-acetylglucosamine transferase [Alphaproteobacteria bacterium]|nr:UDP-N-acetylglucosamine--N-acetylmuramyl-(pentapeptide) pyrophosphoryl-undecaprenol N-acetylglucosamine transferase [Alphaproteobacteria bacterium]MBN2780257.1 UDP-N-acetylglucosamine--N-acetylmuramyl-(pentapeptide) pyrophosphoryl-undecaprenol N-acetylglucosamine transferase [Alphaproteobacteria bacterium]